MQGIGFIDWLLTLALVGVLWRILELGQLQTPGEAPGAGLAPLKERGAAEATASLDETLTLAGRIGGFCDLDDFMAGARIAYEAVVTTFAAGDMGPVAALLDPTIREAFDRAIADRADRGETLSTILIGFVSAAPVDTGLDEGKVWIEVRFVVQLVSATTDREGRVVAGHPNRVDTLSEIWTFAREQHSSDPNWILVATGGDA